MSLDYILTQKRLTLLLKGDFLSYDDIQAKNKLFQEIKKHHPTRIDIKAQDLGKWDSSLVIILFELQKLALKKDISFQTDTLPQGLKKLLELAFAVHPKTTTQNDPHITFLEKIGSLAYDFYNICKRGLNFIHKALKSIKRFIVGTAIMRRIDLWFALEDAGPKAIGIVSLISFMVGLILAFVGAIQLKSFGAQIYVASLVSIGMTRIMGAIMTGIIMAGRTGASYAATIGTMQVNEELDALKTMGFSRTDFLVLPRILALTLTMPLLTMLSDFMGILGGATVGVFMLDISPQEYWKYSVDAFNLTNFFVGLFHGLVFGWVIALCGCYYGIHAGRNADSVGIATTKAVVSAIVWMIVMTGIITWICEVIGI